MQITWTASEKKAAYMMEFRITAATDLAALMTRRARGPWAMLADGEARRLRVEDPEDIRLIRTLFFREQLGKRDIPLREWLGKTQASNICF